MKKQDILNERKPSDNADIIQKIHVLVMVPYFFVVKSVEDLDWLEV